MLQARRGQAALAALKRRRSRGAALLAAALSVAAEPASAGDPPPLQVAGDPPPGYQPLRLPEPEPVAPAALPPPASGAWYTAGRRPYRRAGLRVALGASFRATGKPIAGHTMDFLLGGHFGLHPGREQLGLIPEVGYTFRAPSLEHQLSAGVGLAWGMGMKYHTVAIVPRFVIDPSNGSVGLGARTGLLWCFRENGFSAELAHQYVQKNGEARHDVRATLGIDVLLLAMVLVGVDRL